MVGRKRKLKPNFKPPEWLNVSSESDDDEEPHPKRNKGPEPGPRNEPGPGNQPGPSSVAYDHGEPPRQLTVSLKKIY